MLLKPRLAPMEARSVDEFQLRWHPAASRVQKLAKAHPATYIVFDLLAESERSYLKQSLRERRELLEKFARRNFRSAKNVRLSPATTNLSLANVVNANAALTSNSSLVCTVSSFKNRVVFMY